MCLEDFLKFHSNRMYRNLFNCRRWITVDKSINHLRYEIETRSKKEGIDLCNRYFKEYLHEYFVTGNRSTTMRVLLEEKSEKKKSIWKYQGKI